MTSTQQGERYERSDAQARPLVWSGFALALLVAAALALAAWVDQSYSDALLQGQVASPGEALRKAPEGPELQAVPARELAEQRRWEERMLNDTGWVDPINGIVRIPIERAMELSLAEGFPVRPAPATPATEERH